MVIVVITLALCSRTRNGSSLGFSNHASTLIFPVTLRQVLPNFWSQ